MHQKAVFYKCNIRMCFELIRAYLTYLSEKHRSNSFRYGKPEEEVNGSEQENLGNVTRSPNIDILKKTKKNSQNLEKRHRVFS